MSGFSEAAWMQMTDHQRTEAMRIISSGPWFRKQMDREARQNQRRQKCESDKLRAYLDEISA